MTTAALENLVDVPEARQDLNHGLDELPTALNHIGGETQELPYHGTPEDPEKIRLIPVGESRTSKRGWSFDLKARKEARTAKSGPPVFNLEPQPSAICKTPSKSRPPIVDLDTPPKAGKSSEKSKATLKQPTAEMKKKEFVYKSPERPNFIQRSECLEHSHS